MDTRFRAGDIVVYRKQKNSVRPGPHAKNIEPAAHGDSYSYVVDKFWRVIGAPDDNTLVVITRRGKQLVIKADDPSLRHAYWWERLLFWNRFPSIFPSTDPK